LAPARAGGLFVAAALCRAADLAGLVVVNAGAQGVPEDEGYSVYEDPQKAAICYILSDPANVEEFQGEFGLSDREVESVLAATRAENAALAETYAESETILVESRSLSPVQKKKKIFASSYDEEVKAAVGKAKKRIESKLTEEAAANLQAWVDEQWQQEVGEPNAETARMATAARTGRGGQGMSFRVYTTQYWGYTNYETTLPHRKLKFAGVTRPSSPSTGGRPKSRSMKSALGIPTITTGIPSASAPCGRTSGAAYPRLRLPTSTTTTAAKTSLAARSSTPPAPTSPLPRPPNSA